MYKFLIHIIFFSLIIISCDPGDGRLVFINSSNDTICFIISPKNKIIGRNPIMFDSIKNQILLKESNIILPNTSLKNYKIGKNSWERFIIQECEGKILRVYFFKKSLLDKNNWEVIKEKQLFDKKVEFTLPKLESSQWIINY